jgi:hypothetical protein
LDENAAAVDAAGQGEQQQPGEIADQAQTPGDSPSPRPDAKAEDTDAKQRSEVQKRIDKLVGQRLEREREIAQLRRENESLKAGKSAQATPVADETGPKESDYSDYSKFVEDRAAWRAEKAAEAKFQKLQESQLTSQREARASEELQSQQRSFLTQVENLAAEVPDFQSSVQSLAGQIQTGGPLAQALLQSDKGAALAYYLAAHPAEMARIDAMSSPVRAAIEIARLESRADAHIQSRTRSKASRQASPLDAGGAPKDGAPESAASMEEYARRYYAQRK